MIEMELEKNNQGEEGGYQSEFFYQVDQRLLYFKHGDGLAQIKIEHGNPIDYTYWHQKVIPYSLVLQSLGYDPVQTSREWLATQEELQEEYECLAEQTNADYH